MIGAWGQLSMAQVGMKGVTSFNSKYLLIMNHVPGTVLGAKDKAVNRQLKGPPHGT